MAYHVLYFRTHAIIGYATVPHSAIKILADSGFQKCLMTTSPFYPPPPSLFPPSFDYSYLSTTADLAGPGEGGDEGISV
jgi:hypothetical protein